MGKLFDELKRRKVFRVAAVYAVAAWVLIQVADVVLPTFGAPDWVSQTIIFLFVLGFIPTLIAAWAYEVTPQGVRPDAGSIQQSTSTSSNDRKLIYATFGLVLLVAGFQISDRFLTATEVPSVAETESPGTQNRAVTRVSVRIPEDQFFHPVRGDFDISDDGALFVYRGVDAEGDAQLWLRRWDELSGRPLRDTAGATRPNISPDGQEVVFNSRGAVRVVPLNGGLSRTLVTGNSDTPNWNSDGNWIYFRDGERGISRIPALGGEVQSLLEPNADNGEVDFQNVKELPGGGRLIYTAQMADNSNVIKATDLETGLNRVLALGKHPIYSDTGHLLFQAMDEPILLAAPFDLETLELTGAAIPIAEGLLQVGAGDYGNVGLSTTGRLVYRLGSNAGRPGSPVWIDRAGNESEIDPGWQVQSALFSSSLALSPDGERLAIALSDSQNNLDLWVKRLDNGPLSRITFTGLGNYHPTWSPNGESVIYMAGPFSLKREIWTKRADGSGGAELLLERSNGVFVEEADISPDGRWIVYRERTSNGFSGDIYAVGIEQENEPIPLVVSEYFNFSPALSPDGKWLAYVSNESGQNEVYVRPFPDTSAGRWQVSSSGGTEPVWANSSQELFYRNRIEELVAVKLRAGATFDWVSQEVLFSTADFRSSPLHPSYAVSPDDQRFVMIRLGAVEDTDLILVDNWIEDLR